MKADSLALALLMIVGGILSFAAKHTWHNRVYVVTVLLAVAASAVNPLPWFGQ
jgi:hypothetical protein